MAYRVVEGKNPDQWDVELFDCEYNGYVVTFNYVNVKEVNNSCVLKFDYEILSNHQPQDVSAFNNYLGDMLQHMLQDSINHYEVKNNFKV